VLPVVGPSGAGKSSFVQAGVIPRLRELGAWHVIRLRPGDQPFATLATRLLRDESTARSSSLAAVEEPLAKAPAPDRTSDASLAAALLETPSRLGLRLQQIAEERRCRVLLFVDQMEELYTLCPDEEVRRRFMLAVCTAADDAAEPVRVIFTLRDDHLGRLAEGAQVREALSRLTLIRSPGSEALEQILARPLEAVGYRYEDPELCREMVASVKDEPAPLPLLQFATHLLWERRDEGRRLITRAAYEAVGGVAGALALHADGVLEALSPLQLRQARELFLRLVTVDGTRRILAREAALEGLGDDASLVLDRLTEARLIAVRKGRDDGRSEAELELIHESLIASWARLRRWIDESREEVALLHEMSQAASLWARRGQRDDELWRGEALEDARRAVERLGERAPAEVRRFVDAGLWRARRRTRALRLLTAALIVLLAGVSLFLEHEKRSALTQKENARARWAEAQLEGARAAAIQRSPLEARAKLRGSLETRDSPLARALWRRLAQDAQLWKKPLADSVTEVAFSPDGRSLAAACLDGTIYLFDARTTALRAALKDPHDQVFAIAFSPDGRSLASGTREGWLRLFDLASGALESNRRAHDTTIWAVAFSPDGRRIATAADDATLRTFRAPGLDPEQTLRGHGAGAYDLAFTPDGRRLISGAFDGTVRVWDAAAGGAGRPLGHHASRIYDVAVSPDGRTVASAGMDGAIHLTDLASGATRAVLRGHLSRVLGLAFSPDGERLASGGADQTIRLWRLEARGAREEKVLIGHSDWVRHVAFSPDGKQLASASPDKSVQCWEVAAGGAQRPPTGHTDRVLAVAFHPDGAALATAGADRMVRFWDATTGQERSALSGHSDWVRAVSFSPDGKRLASGGSDQGIRLWDLESASEREVLLGHRHRVHGLGFSPDGKRLASASGDTTVRIWDLQGGSRPLVLEEHRSSVKDVSFSADGSSLASASEDGTIRIWDARAAGKPPRVLEGHRGGVSGVAWSGDGARLLSGGQDHTVRLWEVASGSNRELGQHRGRVYAVALTADGKRAASAGAAGELRLWELTGANASSRELLGHRSEVNAVRFSPRGDLLASVGSDATVRLWSIPSGEPHWRAPALVPGSPLPWLLTHRGWLGEGTAPAAGARWAAAVARARTVSSAGPTLCLRGHDGRLAVWDRALDRRLSEETVPALGAVVASPAGCFVLAGSGLRFYRRTGSFRDLEPGVGSLSRSAETLVLATTATRVLAFNAEGVAAGSYPGGREVSAALLLGTRLILGHTDGRIEVSLIGGTVRRPSAVFRDAPSSPVLLLRAGPAETLLAGHQNGYLALRGLRDGVRLDEAWLHGPLAHLELAGTTAIAASELGDHLRLELSALTAPACDLLREVWQRVPVIWEGGQPIVRAPPRDHPCAPR
jgi:WD40 repeat protein